MPQPFLRYEEGLSPQATTQILGKIRSEQYRYVCRLELGKDDRVRRTGSN